jgi:hypothetical protein
MKHLVLGAVLAFASLAYAYHVPTHTGFGPPTPLCAPDQPSCPLDGPPPSP